MKIYVSGAGIKKALKDRGITQSSLARRMGISRQAMFHIMQAGVQKFSTLNKFAEVLECDPRDLIEVIDE